MTIEEWDGRPVFETEDVGHGVRYYYHVRPSGDRVLLGKYVSDGRGVGRAYKQYRGDNKDLLWEFMASMTDNAVETEFREMNIRILQEEHR